MANDTAQRILDAAESLIGRLGFNAVSVQEVAEAVGLRKASLLHHFPSKADLGVALMRRYRERSAEKLGDPDDGDPAARLDAFMGMFQALAAEPDRQCLGGVLAAELASLPAPLRAEVGAHLHAQERWLAALLAAGQNSGAFAFFGRPEALATVIVAALQGGLITARAGCPVGRMEVIVTHLRRIVGMA